MDKLSFIIELSDLLDKFDVSLVIADDCLILDGEIIAIHYLNAHDLRRELNEETD